MYIWEKIHNMGKDTLFYCIAGGIAILVFVVIILIYTRRQKKIEKITKSDNRKMYQDMQPSEKLRKFIKCYEREGRIGEPAYKIFVNPAGNYELGWGHDFKANGERVTNAMLAKTYTFAELTNIFENDLKNAHNRGLRYFEHIYMTQEMYDALISYLFTTSYPKNVCKLLKKGADYKTVAVEWMNGWTLETSGGNYFRRLAEKDLFLTGKYNVYKKGSGSDYVVIGVDEVKY